jgi:hypothetical protein
VRLACLAYLLHGSRGTAPHRDHDWPPGLLTDELRKSITTSPIGGAVSTRHCDKVITCGKVTMFSCHPEVDGPVMYFDNTRVRSSWLVADSAWRWQAPQDPSAAQPVLPLIGKRARPTPDRLRGNGLPIASSVRSGYQLRLP